MSERRGTLTLRWRQVIAWRLSQHCLSQRLARRNFVEAATRIGGVQAQGMSAAEMALGARVNGLAPRKAAQYEAFIACIPQIPGAEPMTRERLDPHSALQQIARRYLRAYGPKRYQARGCGHRGGSPRSCWWTAI